MNHPLSRAVFFASALCSALLAGPACDKKQDNAAEVKTPALAELRPLWRAGQEATFDFKLRTSTSLGALPSTSELALSGQLTVRVLQGEGSRLVLAVAPAQVKLDKPKGAQADPVELLLQEMGQPFAVELHAGALSAYLDPSDSSMLAFGLRRQLAAVLQRAEPAPSQDRAADGSWQAAEWDASGRATVHYVPEPTGGSAFLWTKSGYEEVLAVRGAHTALPEQTWKPEIVKSRGSVRLDETGLLKLERAEVLQTPLTKDQKLRSQYELTLTRAGSVLQSSPQVAKNGELGGLVRRLPSAPPPAMSTESLDAIRFAGRSFDEVLDLVRAAPDEPSGKSPSDRAAFRQRQMGFNALVGLFRASELNIARALVLIRKQDATSSTLLRALAAASTQDSLTALVQLALDPDTRKAERQRAAANLLRAERPPPELEPSLEKFLAEPLLREHGVLGLGTFSRRWRATGHDAAASAAVARLSTELSAARRPDERVTCLLAVANSGDATLFEKVVGFQTSEDEKIRDAAVQAIRLMDDERVERTLVQLLEGAKEPGAVGSVLTALSHRTKVAESTVRVVEKQTEPSVDAATRRLAVLALAEWTDDWPRLKKTLERLAREDEDERVREAARSQSAI